MLDIALLDVIGHPSRLRRAPWGSNICTELLQHRLSLHWLLRQHQIDSGHEMKAGEFQRRFEKSRFFREGRMRAEMSILPQPLQLPFSPAGSELAGFANSLDL